MLFEVLAFHIVGIHPNCLFCMFMDFMMIRGDLALSPAE